MAQQIADFGDPRITHQRVVLPMSDAARASLMAVRAAQEAANLRVRRQTRRTRAWLGGIVGGIAVGILVFGPRVGAPPRQAASTVATGATANVAPPSTPADTSAQAASDWANLGPGPTGTAAAANPAALSPPAARAEAASPSPAAVAVSGDATQGATRAAAPAPTPATLTAADTACSETFGQRRWRLSIESCTQAFQARPNDGALALRIAHAHHARAGLSEAGEWAHRAITLDPTLAEAFVIVAHAEKRAGRPAAALTAYRRYLALAPRGWHASEARAAVRPHARQKRARAAARVPAPAHAEQTVSVATDE